MKKLIFINVCMFPLLLSVMVWLTGTWSSVVVPSSRRALGSAIDGGGIPNHATLIDSLRSADLIAEHRRLAVVRDSIQDARARLEIERRELASLVAELDERMNVVSARESEATGEQARERESLARVFQEMDPERAVDVLQHLDDSNIEYLMKTMQRRQAAEMLAQLDPIQAARLSARILTPRLTGDEKERSE